MRLLRRRGLLAFALLPLASLAAPTTEPANFASASLLALQIVLGAASDPTITIHAARVGEAALAEVVPAVCRRSCNDYLTFEPPCMQLKTEEACGEAFCTEERIDQFIGCLNCLVLTGNTTNISQRRYPGVGAQLTVLQNACTQSTALVAPQNHLLPYEAVGTDASGAASLSISLASTYASSSGPKRIGPPMLGWSSLGIGLVAVMVGGGGLLGMGGS